MKNKASGQITIFSAIVLLSVLTLAGILVDISRISSGRAMVKRAVGTAAKSLLADYGSRLKEDYGLFAIPVADTASLQDRFEEYLACNLSIPYEEEYYKDSTDLFGFRIERVSVTPVYNLSENPVTKKQILEYMKYRAPAELVEGFVERLSAVREVGKMSGAYKKKVGIDKLLGSMDKAQQNLKKYVDGWGNAGDKYINGFNLGGNWEAAFNSFNSLAAGRDSLKNSLESLDSSISELKNRKAQENEKQTDISTSDKEADTSTSNTGNDAYVGLESLIAERAALQQSYSEANTQLRHIWNEVRYQLTESYMKSNENAAGEIKKIVEKGKKAQAAIAELESYLSENFGSEEGTFSKDFKEQTQLELEELKSLILDGRKAEEMLADIAGNSSLLKNIIAKLEEAGVNIIADTGPNTGSNSAMAGGLPSELIDMVREYINVNYHYSKPAVGDKNDDPRAGKADAVKEFIAEKILKDVNYKTAGIKEIDLPSFTKVITESFDKEDEDFINGGQVKDGGGAGEDTGARKAAYEGDLKNIGDEVDLYDEEGMLQENALGFISDIGSLLTGEAVALRDNIYLNEYIMGTFKNSVTSIQRGNKTIKDINLHGVDKASLQSFYDSEVEYVLHGNASQQMNNIMTKGEVLLIRFGLNTLHVYTDGKKKTMATGIATAVAGWWTGGAGIPILSNLIMCGWGMGEAVLDMQDLMEGKSVPIYKMKGDWKLDVGLPAAVGPKTDNRLYFSYHDYLRLFLLTMDENKKLDRLEDLIQLNLGKTKSGFRMSACNTFVRIEAEVSMKHLFITLPFVQKAVKTNDGRYVFKVLIYEGY